MACNNVSLPPFRNSVDRIYEGGGRLYLIAKRPPAQEGLEVEGMTIMAASASQPMVDIEVGIAVTVNAFSSSRQNIDELLVGINLPTIIAASSPGPYPAVSVRINAGGVTGGSGIDPSLSVGQAISVKSVSSSLSMASPEITVSIDVSAFSGSSLIELESLVIDTAIPTSAFSAGIANIFPGLNLGPNIVAIGSSRAFGFLSIGQKITVSSHSSSETQNELAVGQKISVNPESASLPRINNVNMPVGLGVGYILSKRSSIDRSHDSILFDDTQYGPWSLFKADIGTLDDSSDFLFLTPFKAEMSEQIRPMRILDICSDYDIGEFRYEDPYTFLFVCNAEPITGEVYQDGDTNEIVIPSSSSKIPSLSYGY